MNCTAEKKLAPHLFRFISLPLTEKGVLIAARFFVKEANELLEKAKNEGRPGLTFEEVNRFLHKAHAHFGYSSDGKYVYVYKEPLIDMYIEVAHCYEDGVERFLNIPLPKPVLCKVEDGIFTEINESDLPEEYDKGYRTDLINNDFYEWIKSEKSDPITCLAYFDKGCDSAVSFINYVRDYMLKYNMGFISVAEFMARYVFFNTFKDAVISIEQFEKACGLYACFNKLDYKNYGWLFDDLECFSIMTFQDDDGNDIAGIVPKEVICKDAWRDNHGLDQTDT